MTLRNHAWLWLLVALQVAIPASYYVRSSDRDDERFAWRMFSAVRVKRCSVRMRERRDGIWQPVALESSLHSSWQNQLERGRRRVITRVLENRCASPGVEAAELTRRCRAADGAKLPRELYSRACGSGGAVQEALE